MDADQLTAAAIAAVDADPQARLESGLAAAVLRQAVHQRGSVPRGRLLAEAAQLLAPLATCSSAEVRELIVGDLDSLLALGEVVLRQPAPGAHVHVEPGQPAFVQVEAPARAEFLIVGGSLDGRPVLPPSLAARVTPRGRARWLLAEGSAAALREELGFYGLREVPFAAWARTPPAATPTQLAAPLRERAMRVAAERVATLELFDPSSDAGYYRGRLRRGSSDEAAAMCAQFRWVPARERDVDGFHYCIVFHDNGGFSANALGVGVDARDTWLRIAAAACHGRDPTRAFRCERDGDVLRLYFPPPSWLERLLALGAPVRAGGLCAYRVPDAAWPAVHGALTDVLFAKVIHV